MADKEKDSKPSSSQSEDMKAAKNKAKDQGKKTKVVKIEKEDKSLKTPHNNKAKFEHISQFAVPFGCYLDEHTIINKNGELLQIFKITGASHDDIYSINDEKFGLRYYIRDAIKKHVTTNKVAIWFHTVRLKHDLSFTGEYDNTFSKDIAQEWQKFTREKIHHYHNEVYVSILYEGYKIKISDSKGFFSSIINFLSFPFSKDVLFNEHQDYIETANKELTTIVDAVRAEIKQYKTHKLSLYEKGGEMYSDHLKFFYTLLSLNTEEVKLPLRSLSDEVTSSYSTAFGFDVIQIRNNITKKTQLAKIFTIKEYAEVSIFGLDKFFSLPISFIISQAIDFISDPNITKEFEYQKRILSISGDNELSTAAELDRILSHNPKGSNSFCEYQVNMLIFSEDNNLEKFNKLCEKVVEHVNEAGIIVIKEDIRLAPTFYSAMPGNFHFLHRQKIIDIDRIAGFCAVNTFPVGKRIGNKWKDYVTIFPTSNGTEYFFNFHVGDNGHSMIIGPDINKNAILQNFLLASSNKFDPRIIIIETDPVSLLFTEAMDGVYYNINSASTEVSSILELNALYIIGQLPISLELKTSAAISYMGQLINATTGETHKLSEQSVQHMQEYLQKIYSITDEEVIRKDFANIYNISNLFEPHDVAFRPEFKKTLNIWGRGGKLSHVLNSIQFNPDIPYLNNDLTVFNLAPFAKHSRLMLGVVSLLIMLIEVNITPEKPTIIVFNDAVKILCYKEIMKKMSKWMTNLTNRNAICIFNPKIEDFKFVPKDLAQEFLDSIATKIFTPNLVASQLYLDYFGMNVDDLKKVIKLSEEEGEFLLRHAEVEVICKLSIEAIANKLPLLYNYGNMQQLIEQIKQNNETDDPKEWLPFFYEYVNEMMGLNNGAPLLSMTPVEEEKTEESVEGEEIIEEEEEQAVGIGIV